MKLSLSMIEKQLDSFEFVSNITMDRATITSLRMLPEEPVELRDEYVYFGIERAGESASSEIICITLTHGTDCLRINTNTANETLDAVLSAMDYYNEWEDRIIDMARKHASLQDMIDASDLILDNPSFIMDFEGNVLAITPEHESRAETSFYKGFRESGKVDPKSTSLAMTDKSGNPVQYNSDQIPYVEPTGADQLPFLPATIMSEGEPAGILIVSQSNPQLMSMNRHIMKTLLMHLASAREFSKDAEHPMLRSSILCDLLDGQKVDDVSIVRITAHLPASSYVLLIFRPSFNTDNASQKLNAGQLLHALNYTSVQNIHAMYSCEAVAMVPYHDVDRLIGDLSKTFGLANWKIGMSLPFSNVRTMPLRYRQARFAIAQGDGKMGLFRCEDHALEYIISKMRTSADILELRHPAVIILKHYDEEHSSDLGETLFQYLRLDRNLAKASEALCVHRNSLVYRLGRVRELCSVDFEDPEENMYLLLSFYFDRLGANEQRHLEDRTISALTVFRQSHGAD